MQELSCCGTNCKECGCFGSLCIGCNECKGKVFHAPKGDACPIYVCAINKNGLENCGKCNEVACDTWRATRDPKFTDEEFETNIKNRVKSLQENM